MDHKEGGQGSPTEFRDEVLPANTQNQMATKDNQCRSTPKNEGDNQCDARGNQEKNDNVRAHMQNDTGQAGKEGDGGIYGRKQQKGKTKKRMVTGYRGMGREKCTNADERSAGPEPMEDHCHACSRHQRVETHGPGVSECVSGIQ